MSARRSAAIALGATDLTGSLSDIRVPTLVVHGEHDRVSNQEQPAAFNAAVRAFLDALP